MNKACCVRVFAAAAAATAQRQEAIEILSINAQRDQQQLHPRTRSLAIRSVDYDGETKSQIPLLANCTHTLI